MTAWSSLGLRRDRVVVTGLAPSPRSHTGCAPGEDPFERLREAMPTIRAGFVLYPGGSDVRKNVDGLARRVRRPRRGAASRAPAGGHCAASTRSSGRALAARIRDLSLTDDVLAVGLVSDDVLAAPLPAALTWSCSLRCTRARPPGDGSPPRVVRLCSHRGRERRSSSSFRHEATLRPVRSQATSHGRWRTTLDDPRIGSPSLRQIAGAARPHLAGGGRANREAAYRTEAKRRVARRRRRPRPHLRLVSPLPPEATGVADSQRARLAVRLARGRHRRAVHRGPPGRSRRRSGFGVHHLGTPRIEWRPVVGFRWDRPRMGQQRLPRRDAPVMQAGGRGS